MKGNAAGRWARHSGESGTVHCTDRRPAKGSDIAVDHVQHVDPLVLAVERHALATIAVTLDINAAANALVST
jgi:hypothetical protein